MISDEQSFLPAYEKFKKMNSLVLRPPKREGVVQEEKLLEPLESKKGLIMNDSKYKGEIKYALRQIASHHISRFEAICDNVILDKYDAIYSQIGQYMDMLINSTGGFFHAMIINTDQNASSFFEGLGKFLYKKQKDSKEHTRLEANKLILPKGESHFKDLSKLFTDLELGLDFDDDRAVSLPRLIVIGEIQRIDQITLNIFLKRLMEYELMKYKKYSNILVFDVSYDPRNLLEKIKANQLSKMILHQVHNVPSKNIYKEVLYKYVFEQGNCLFIPNSNNTKMIVDYINSHQISIGSFQHYFKFSILSFFAVHSWDNDEYLLFSAELEEIAKEDEAGRAEKKRKFFKRKLKQLYGKENEQLFCQDDVESLVESYDKHFNNRSVFFDFYLMFESILAKLSKEMPKDYEPFEKFQFFFEFLQYDNINDSNKASSRVRLLEKYFKRFPNEDYIQLINDYILVEYKALCEKVGKNKVVDSEVYARLTQMVKKLEVIADDGIEDNSFPKEDLNSTDSKKKYRLKTTKDIFNQLMHWLEVLFTESIFDIINDFDRDETTKKKKRKWLNVYKNYFSFSEAVNPSLGLSIMNALSDLTKEVTNCKEDEEKAIEEKCSFAYALKEYIACFKRLGASFKLKLFFIEFLNGMEVSIDDNDSTDKRKQLKTVFLYLSYAFCLIGFFSKKKGMGNDAYMKNYFEMSNYYTQS